MARQLTKGMFGYRRFRASSNLFGLRCQQIRYCDFVRNGGWYNKAGERLGWGDLSLKDFLRISSELENGELFIVLYELDSYWNFCAPSGIIGTTKITRKEPGVDYVAEHCCFIIVPGLLYGVPKQKDSRNANKMCVEKVQFKVLERDAARQLVTTGSLP